MDLFCIFCWFFSHPFRSSTQIFTFETVGVEG